MMLIDRIADYVVGEQTNHIDAQTIHHAKRAVIDWFAAMYPGSQQDPNPMLRAAFAEDLGRGSAVVYPSGERATTRAAAFLNAASSHTAEFDDIFRDATVHPGCATIAAALAVGQANGASGETMLRGVIAGYEVCSRIARALGKPHYKLWHTTATTATFGASAAATVIMGLNRDQTRDALTTAATMAAGLQQAFRSDGMSKPIHAGHAADAGVLSALVAAKGVTGAKDVLEGPAGMGVAMSGEADWSQATDGLGERYNINSMTFKNHGCCGHTFAAIDGAVELRKRHGLTPERIARIHVGTYSAAVDITNKPDPQTQFECRFSLPYVMCTGLVHGKVRLIAFEPERMADKTVRALMKKVEVTVDPELDATFPAQRAARVTITTTDGEEFTFLQPTRKGDPDQPLTDDDLADKFFELSEGVIPASSSKVLLDALWGLETRANLDLPGALETSPAPGAVA